MPLPQTDIDEISDAFSDAWEETFGAEVFYLRYNPSTQQHPLYGEVIGKEYEEIGPIYAIFKQNPTIEELKNSGISEHAQGILVFVTKDLREQGVTKVSTLDRVKIVDRDGVTSFYTINGYNLRVQFYNNYIFTHVGVVHLGNEEP